MIGAGLLRVGGCALVLSAAALLAACAYSASDADRDYLRAFCEAVDRFSDSLASSDPDTALDEFEAALETIDPSPRMAEFHVDFLAFVRDALADPAELAAGQVPSPDPETRAALASIETEIDECWRADYFEPAPP